MTASATADAPAFARLNAAALSEIESSLIQVESLAKLLICLGGSCHQLTGDELYPVAAALRGEAARSEAVYTEACRQVGIDATAKAPTPEATLPKT
jgi:hypothetical protein